MKIKKLHLYNIASIEDEVIDFTAAPLVDSEVFLITGKTGSGKTTILDAICLALYRTTPRLSACEKTKVEVNSDCLTLNDPRQLMRRNTGEAFVTLTFEGIDGAEYEAEWHVQRGKKKKANVSPDPATWSLKNLTTGTSISCRGEKDGDVRAAMLNAVGLEFSQFCRTTMLAQGEFTKFLKSNEKEKVEILEKITHFTDYTEIGKRIFLITSEKKKAWDEAHEKAQDAGLNDTEIEALKGQIQELVRLVEQKSQQKTVVDKKLQWLKDYEALAAEQKQIENELADAVLKTKSDEFVKNQKTINEWKETADARQAFLTQEETTKKLCELNDKLTHDCATYKALLGGIAFTEHAYNENEAQLKALDEHLKQQQGNEPIYNQASVIAVHLNSIADNRNKIAEQEKIIESCRQQLEKVLKQYDSAEQALNAAKQQYAAAEETITRKVNEVEALGLKALRNRKDAINTLLHNINTAKDRISNLSAAKQERLQQANRLAEQSKALDTKRREAKNMETPIAEAKGRMEATEVLLNKQKDTIDKWAKNMRQQLKVGDVCPVCHREIVAALPHEDVLDGLYADAKRVYDTAKNEYDIIIGVLNQKNAQINADQDAYLRDKLSFDNDKSVTNAEEKALAACKACGIDLLTDDIVSLLNEKEQHSLDELNHPETGLLARISKGEKKEEELKKERTQLELLKKQIDGKLQLASEQSKKEKEKCETTNNTAMIVIENTRPALQQEMNQVAAFIDVALWTDNPKLYGEQLNEAAKRYTEKQAEKQRLESSRATLKQNLDQVHEVNKHLLQFMPAWSDVEKPAAAKVDNLVIRLNTLSANVGSNLNLITTEKRKRMEAQTCLDGFISQHPSFTLMRIGELSTLTLAVIEALEKNTQEIIRKVDDKKTIFGNVKHRINTHLQKKAELTVSEEDNVVSLTAQTEEYEKEMTQFNQDLGAKKKALTDDEQKKKGVAALVAAEQEAHAAYDRWNRVNMHIGDKEGTKFQKIAQSFILGSLLNSANVYLNKLAPRYTLKAVPGTLFISLEDAYQGFATRGTDSLSGGEGFLVSLALALALADIGENLQVDTLFIDEGFGTLSGAPLTNAINTLRSLHTQSGRHVGIISHIEEVKNNIPVQITLEQTDNSSSSKVVITPSY